MAVTAVVEAGWIVGMREIIGWFGKIVVPGPAEGADTIACNNVQESLSNFKLKRVLTNTVMW